MFNTDKVTDLEMLTSKDRNPRSTFILERCVVLSTAYLQQRRP